MGEAGRDEAEGRFFHVVVFQAVFPQVFGWRFALQSFEECAEGAEAFEAYGVAGCYYRCRCPEELFGLCDADLYQVLVGCFAVDLFELADEMELGGVGRAGDVVDFEGFGVVAVDI